jgi:hypothetical protein
VDAASGAGKRSVDGLTDAMTGLGFKVRTRGGGWEGCLRRACCAAPAPVCSSCAAQLLHSEEAPFLIREHVRKFQWGCSLVTVWQRA